MRPKRAVFEISLSFEIDSLTHRFAVSNVEINIYAWFRWIRMGARYIHFRAVGVTPQGLPVSLDNRRKFYGGKPCILGE